MIGRTLARPLRSRSLIPVLATLLALTQPAGAQGQGAQIPLPPTSGVGAEAETETLAARQSRYGQRSAGTLQGAQPETVRPALLSPLRPVQARARAAGSALRFDGERRSLDFSLYLPDPGRVMALRIATLSSINLLPERSSFRVLVNGTLVGTGRLDNFTTAGITEFPLPAQALRRGANDVRIELVQYHRIFCGPEASFALWSDIDLAQSGAVLDATDAIAGDAAFRMALAAAAATGSGLELRGTELLGDQRDAWLGEITQRIAASLGGDPMPLRFSPTWSVAAPSPVAARITFLPAIPGQVPAVRFATGGDGAQVMVIGVSPGSAPVPMPVFDTIFPPIPRRDPVPAMTTQRPVPLAELGFQSVELRDRYSLTEIPFRLPDDYVVLTSGKSEMTLTYIYSEDLPQGSVLQIHVNGVNVRVLPLRGQGGQLIQDFPIRFNAHHLRGGVNTLAFEVMVPGDPADLPCPHREQPVVAISDRSTIAAPYSPSMYLADMHYAFAALTPRGIVISDLTARAFDQTDVLTLRAALAPGQREGLRDAGARLNLIAIEDLGGVPSGGYQISRRAIERVLAPPGTDPTPLFLADSGSGPSGGADALLMRFERPENRNQSGGQTAALTAGWDWLRLYATMSLQLMHPRAGPLLELWLSSQRGQAILLQLDPAQPNQLWLLRAHGSDVNAIAAAIVAARTMGHGPRGQVSVLDDQGRWQNWTAPDRQPVLLEPLSIGNLRHVLGNFVSAMPIRYVLGLFFLALISAVLALRFVIATRETPQ
jgi:cellulose synthase operon protein B